MSELDDHQLLAEFTRTHSEAAFAALAERHVNLVYSVALRSVGNAHAAEEISQAVFIILARKARTLSPKIVLSGWLYQTTRLAAANFLRGEIRRQQREQEAYMQSTLNESEPQVWSQIAPLLDDALGRLGEADRNAIVLRFFENKNLREVGATLGASEDTAKMRVNRALEKLRKMFRKRGVNLTATIIAVAVSANSVQAAPVGLAMTVTAAVAKGAVVSGSTLTLIKGALKLMAWTKAKIAIAVGVGMLLAVGTTTIAVKQFQAHHRYSWQMPKATRDLIRNTPPQVVIVPSKFSQDGGTYRDYMKGGGTMGICQSVTNIVRIAFDNDIDRMILSEGLPEGRFDFFARVSDTDWPFWQKPLQTELKLKLGVIGRLERRETDVLLLQYRNPNAGGLKPPGSLDGLRRSLNLSKYTTGNVTTNSLYERDQTISGLQDFLRVSFALPIIDQTGLTNKYDFLLKWNDAVPIHPNKEGIKQAVLDQLGLELVPGRALVEMLVVEKVN